MFTTRQQYRWPENAVFFCNFIQLYKIDPDIQKMWVTILHKVRGADTSQPSLTEAE